ncbi:MAG: polysulfide reductase NrfD, partial [Flavobacteriaceae bacterium]|nr:polysulfide reductase NrfD [Flavobacteriaceae bacterium]
MHEELFSSGRNIPHIDPVLEIWHWPISVYLFLGGLSAGLLFFAAVVNLMNKEKDYPAVVKQAMIIPPI